MSQFYKLRALSLVFWFVFLTTKVYAQSTEPKDKFLQSLEGIESQIYALPQSSLAQIESLEEDSLLQNQPKDLLIRYWLAKSTVLELLGRDKESLAVVDKGLSLTPEQSQEHLLFKLIQIRAMMGNRDIDTALSSLDALLETSREKGDKKLESEVLLLKGRYYDEQGDYKKSYAALMSSMEAAESSGAQGLVERAALELGDVLVKIQGYDRSEVVLKQAYRYFKDRRMSFNELLSVLTIAKLHKAQFQYDEAITSYQAALKLAQIIGDGRFRFRVNLELASLYRETNNEKNMLRHLKLAENLQYRETSNAYLATFKLLQAEYMLERKQYQALLTMITPLLPEIIESRYIKQQQMELLKVAAMAYAGDQNFELAYQTYGQYHEKFIQFSNQREVESLERQQTLFELERLEYENENLNWNNVLQRLELENNRRTFYLLGEVLLVMIGILLLMALVFLYVNRSRLRMRRLAKTDMLTGLFNRRFLEEWFAKPAEQKPKLIEKPIPETKKGQLVHKLNKQVMRVQYGYLALNHWVERKLDKQKMVAKKPETGPITLVMMDVDHFKQVNDTYGHVFGDVVLTGVAKVLDSSVRESDIVARLGGEEFVIVLPNTDLEEATALAERLRIALSQRGFVTENNQAVNVTCSFGVITSDDVDVSFEALCSQADKLLYEAKSSGRNCVKALSFS
ncbi:GGDEF domain-containing protein [Vibrio parahaemolyticus]|uniref:tetratricopeptide repeat-containing diguanylate cyclase n=1 Tax=Vibrio parahaemolyticus TaxID=670 RepID=UPI00215CA4A6|nr:GGDEF domain-containing protein [Vibrio parahaemolyticus]MCS0058826.1 GGDEF domain-containing protein [Vibrio parahaemolyticus]